MQRLGLLAARIRNAYNKARRHGPAFALGAADRVLGRYATVDRAVALPFRKWFPALDRGAAELLERRLGPEASIEFLIRAERERPTGSLFGVLAKLTPSRAAGLVLAEHRDALFELVGTDRARQAALAGFAARCNARELAADLLDKLTTGDVLAASDEVTAFSALLPVSITAMDGKPGPPDAADLEPRASEHRCLILGLQLELSEIAHLAEGAKALTVVTYKDYYGTLDVQKLRDYLPAIEITVEHARTRMDRYSMQYRAMHDRANALVKQIIRAADPLQARFVASQVHRAGLRPAAIMQMADTIFFRALQMNAIYRVATDRRMDDVVAVLDSEWRLYRLLANIALEDRSIPLRLCCWAREKTDRVKHYTRCSAALDFAQKGLVRPRPKPFGDGERDKLEQVVRDYCNRAGVQAGKRLRQPKQSPVAVIASHERPYVGNAVQIALQLRKRIETDLIWSDRSGANLDRAITDVRKANGNYARIAQPVNLLGATVAPTAVENAAFKRLFAVQTQATINAIVREKANGLPLTLAVLNESETAIPAVLLAQLGMRRSFMAIFKRGGYRALVTLPIRRASNMLAVAVARAMSIPTLGVEPHVFVASYCRHSKMPTDYVALYNDFFAHEYEENYGIPRERAFTIGSPRVERPEQYEERAARNAARGALGIGSDAPPLVLVAAQPLGRQHSLAVWRMIVQASTACEHPVRVLMKPHPEDGPDRIADYRTIIRQEGASDRCDIAAGSFDTFLQASDLLLVLFSVAALQAATLGKRVAVVNLPGAEYPLRYDRVLDIPLCTTTADVTAVIEEAARNPNDERPIADLPETAPPRLGLDYYERLFRAVEHILEQGEVGVRSLNDVSPDPFVRSEPREYLLEV